MTKPELIARNKKLTMEVQTSIDLLTTLDSLPSNGANDALVRELIRCATSIGTNYETTRSTKSKRDFINKLKKQEIDNKSTKEKLNNLLAEGNQLLSIYSPSRKRIGKSQTS